VTSVGKLLTQQEVAEILRRDVKSEQRLRAKGELGYLPGRPVMIPQAELDAYLERRMVKRQVVDPVSAATPSPQASFSAAASTPNARKTPEERANAMLAKMKRDGSLDGLIRLQREVAEQQRRKALQLSEKATSRRHCQTKAKVPKS